MTCRSRLTPPDIIDVEVLEALPGRPITGGHLVMPDGTITLGFYGKVHVRGLTLEQAKVKIILHLRTMIADHVLGIEKINEFGFNDRALDEMPRVPEAGQPPIGPFLPPPVFPVPGDVPPPGLNVKPTAAETSPVAPPAGQASGKVFDRSNSQSQPLIAPKRISRESELVQVQAEPAAAEAPTDPQSTLIDPVLSRRVFVEITSFNSKVYYVQGDVGVPGRLPCTGHDTVLDALNYAGGFLPSADLDNIHLYRPARGDQPAKDFKINYQGILKANAVANLQLFSGDRLVIGRTGIAGKNGFAQMISR